MKTGGGKMLKRTFLIALSVVFVLTVLTSRESRAAANGNGICEEWEKANFDCGNFGGAVIEFVDANDVTCSIAEGGSVPCTRYYYRYSAGTTSGTNQVNVLIPLVLTETLNLASEVGCQQYITDGSGDPTTLFGAGIFTMGVCRIPSNFATLPFLDAPPQANFYIATDPSLFDPKVPAAWQVRFSKTNVYNQPIIGPATSQPAVLESEVTLRTKKGNTVSYQIEGGNIVITSSGATLFEMNEVFACYPSDDGQVMPFSQNGTTYRCDAIDSMTDQCDVEVNCTLRSIGGKLICY